ncbi:MAG TPA: hypothetical protein DEV81_11650 [Cyanobacteria bacterium UBA11049]|nr:hypothetical protein [Cyanobacteria bacterium UBA11049]
MLKGCACKKNTQSKRLKQHEHKLDLIFNQSGIEHQEDNNLEVMVQDLLKLGRKIQAIKTFRQ